MDKVKLNIPTDIFIPDTLWSFVLPRHYHMIPMTLLNILYWYLLAWYLPDEILSAFDTLKLLHLPYHLNN